MPIWVRAFMVVSFFLVNTPAFAAEICASTPEGLAAARRAITEIQALAQAPSAQLPLKEPSKTSPFFELVPKQKTPWGTDVTPYMYGQADPGIQAQKPEERRFSWYGYRHAELHKQGVIDELLEKTKGKNCCSGVYSGECRVTKYITDGVGKRRVQIDGMNCEITDDTRIVQLDRFAEQDTVVVCAHKTDDPARGYERQCPRTYCIGGGRNGI